MIESVRKELRSSHHPAGAENRKNAGQFINACITAVSKSTRTWVFDEPTGSGRSMFARIPSVSNRGDTNDRVGRSLAPADQKTLAAVRLHSFGVPYRGIAKTLEMGPLHAMRGQVFHLSEHRSA
jgi:hypothetical protein